ncbi:type II secretion system F family protein [Bacillota bacterium LX-D]|nr:type II secretion system F family protein [Bacillota bacterium LX-D]
MPKFFYKARDEIGKLYEGRIEAENINDVVRQLRNQNLYIIKIVNTEDIFKLQNIFNFRIPPSELAIFCRQFSSMYDSGLPLYTVITILQNQVSNKKLHHVLKSVGQSLQEGTSLAAAFEKHIDILPNMMISMLRAGEVSGTLNKILRRMAVYFEKDYNIREKIKTAMIYPVILIFVFFISAYIVSSYVLPAFQEMAMSLGIELPFTTKLIFGVNNLIVNFWYFFVFGLVILLILMQKTYKTERGAALWNEIQLKIPIFGDLLQKIIIARFARILSVLLDAGTPILLALEMSKKTVNNRIILKTLDEIQSSIRQGKSISSSLLHNKAFPPLVIQMIEIGEEIGQLDRMLEKLSTFYEEEINHLIGRLNLLIEPFTTIIMGVLAGAFVGAVLLPIYNAINSL